MIRFGSRGSELALAQTRLVAEALRQQTGEEFTIEVIRTRGDDQRTAPLSQIGGKGLFTAELEAALRDGRIDVAVHSLKDLPVEDPDGVVIAAIPARADPRDVLLFAADARDPEGGTIPLLGHCCVGTSSPRRRAALAALRPDLEFAEIRGNIDTRARKVASGGYHATVLAAAGLERIGLPTPGLERAMLPPELVTPAPGQGALALQCRAEDARLHALVASIHDDGTAVCVKAERRVLELLGGGCSMPLGVLVRPDGPGRFHMLVSLFGVRRPRCRVALELLGSDADALATDAAEQLGPLLAEPLRGQRIVLLRSGAADASLARALGLAGAEVESIQVNETLPIPDALSGLTGAPLAVVAFTSAEAVDRFFEGAAAFGHALGSTRFFGVGPATAQAVQRRGHPCEAPSPPAGGAALAGLVVARTTADTTVLFPCAETRQPDFEAGLRRSGREVVPVPVYRIQAIGGVAIPPADHVLVMSPSAVPALVAAGPATAVLAIGKATARAVRAAGLALHGVAHSPTPRAVIDLIQGLRDDPPSTPPPPDAGDP